MRLHKEIKFHALYEKVKLYGIKATFINLDTEPLSYHVFCQYKLTVVTFIYVLCDSYKEIFTPH